MTKSMRSIGANPPRNGGKYLCILVIAIALPNATLYARESDPRIGAGLEKILGYAKKRLARDNPRARLIVRETQALDFGTFVANNQQVVTVHPADSNAAIFSLRGERFAQLSLRVVERKVYLSRHPNNDGGQGGPRKNRIVVQRWRYGGNTTSNGTVTLDQFGKLTNIRVGASATITQRALPGQYSGKATLRVIHL